MISDAQQAAYGVVTVDGIDRSVNGPELSGDRGVEFVEVPRKQPHSEAVVESIEIVHRMEEQPRSLRRGPPQRRRGGERERGSGWRWRW